MGFNESELWRIKRELGYPAETIGALPYLDLVSVFEQVILPYTQSGADTTSNTVVDNESPDAVVLKLADTAGFHVWDRVFVDVDDSQESATIQSLDGTGKTICVILSKQHGSVGAYPVIVDGGVAQARNLLRLIEKVTAQIEDAPSRAGIKKVDEIEFFGSSRSGKSTTFEELREQREDARRELAEVLGLPYLRGLRRGPGRAFEVY
jgi:hypothetical protein